MTLLRQFKEKMKTDDSPEKIRDFLGLVNSQYLALKGINDMQQKDIPEDKMVELENFLLFMMNKGYYEKAKTIIEDRWPSEPFAFRLFVDYKRFKEGKDFDLYSLMM